MTHRVSQKLLRSVTRAVVVACAILPAIAQSPASQGAGKQDVSRSQARLAEEVRHVLVMLPYYGVFDNLEFRIESVDTVVLSGQVTRPTLKSDAEKRVKGIEGAGKVVNNIEVLPLSPNDDQLRLAAYRAIYSRPGLDRYALMAVPPIHIILKSGNLRLIGVVATPADKDLAGIAANGVSGVFGVTNDLSVERK